jgi:hypothetical protein
MSFTAWFFITVIVTIVTIGVNSTLCTYWEYKYKSQQATEKKPNTEEKERCPGMKVTGFKQ